MSLNAVVLFTAFTVAVIGVNCQNDGLQYAISETFFVVNVLKFFLNVPQLFPNLL